MTAMNLLQITCLDGGCTLKDESTRLRLEALQAMFAAEVVGLAVVLMRTGAVPWVHTHAADRVDSFFGGVLNHRLVTVSGANRRHYTPPRSCIARATRLMAMMYADSL